jgi:hypothetical protein
MDRALGRDRLDEEDVRGWRSWKRVKRVDIVWGQDGGQIGGRVAGEIEAQAGSGGWSRSQVRSTKVVEGDELTGQVRVVEEAARGGRSWKMLKEVDQVVVELEVDVLGDGDGWRIWKGLKEVEVIREDENGWSQ